MRPLALIEAELITAGAAAHRCPRILADGRSQWDVAHRQIDQLLHEWRTTITTHQTTPAAGPA